MKESEGVALNLAVNSDFHRDRGTLPVLKNLEQNKYKVIPSVPFSI